MGVVWCHCATRPSLLSNAATARQKKMIFTNSHQHPLAFRQILPGDGCEPCSGSGSQVELDADDEKAFCSIFFFLAHSPRNKRIHVRDTRHDLAEGALRTRLETKEGDEEARERVRSCSQTVFLFNLFYFTSFVSEILQKCCAQSQSRIPFPFPSPSPSSPVYIIQPPTAHKRALLSLKKRDFRKSSHRSGPPMM